MTSYILFVTHLSVWFAIIFILSYFGYKNYRILMKLLDYLECKNKSYKKNCLMNVSICLQENQNAPLPCVTIALYTIFFNSAF